MVLELLAAGIGGGENGVTELVSASDRWDCGPSTFREGRCLSLWFLSQANSEAGISSLVDGAVALLVLELVQAELEPEVSACRALECPSKCWDTDRLGWFRVAGDSEGPKAASLLVGGSTSQPSKQQGLRCSITDAGRLAGWAHTNADKL